MGTLPGRFVALARRLDRVSARWLAATIAIVGGILVGCLAVDLFPYHSLNHDEGVYLQQAAMLLEGQLTIDPPVDAAFRPWFFVAEDGVMYPKYTPVPAAMFAVGLFVGLPRLALVAIAAATIGLTYATVTEVFDSRTGLVAAALLVATPLFLIQASVFLPYVPTLALLLCFACAYLRADRKGDRRWAALAGAAAGLAFFARPYTAVLFALPFVFHALWTMIADDRDAIERQLLTAAVGLLGVALALAYNWSLTGSPLRFPYQAFGPLDGPGFGRRALLGREVVYDLELALESAWIALRQYVLRWSVAAPLGAVLAAVGLGTRLRRWRFVDTRKLVLAGLFVTIPVGQLYFWGTFNAISTLEDPGLGLLGHLGPFYHLGLVLPTVAFGADAMVRGWDRLRPRLSGVDSRRTLAGLAAIGVLLAGVAGVTTVGAVADPVAQNRAVTEAYEDAYEPFADRSFDDALVFLPTPYGPWLNHPFQALRNEPHFDGPAVYALDRAVFDVRDAYPDRTLYRYAYRGDWFPADDESVSPVLRRVSHVDGERVKLTVEAGLPTGTESAALTLRTGAGETVTLPLDAEEGRVAINVTATAEAIRVAGHKGASRSLSIADEQPPDLTVYVDTGGLDSFEYDLEWPLRTSGERVEALSPRLAVCRGVQQCGDGSVYVPGAHRSGVSLETNLTILR